jgi:hypothetical protein
MSRVDQPIGPGMDGYQILSRELKLRIRTALIQAANRQSGTDSAVLGYRRSPAPVLGLSELEPFSSATFRFSKRTNRHIIGSQNP